MKKVYCFVILFFLMQSLYSQNESEAESYSRNAVKLFYLFLQKDSVSISDFSSVYCGGDVDNDIFIHAFYDSKNNHILSFRLSKEARDSLQRVYATTASSSSYIFQLIKKHKGQLTMGLPYEQIVRKIDSAEFFDNGATHLEGFLKLNLAQSIQLYFKIRVYQKSGIEEIGMPNGLDFKRQVVGLQEYFKLVGSVKKREGRHTVDVFRRPIEGAEVIDKVGHDDFFFYIPSNQKWWKVFKKNSFSSFDNFWGYLNREDILRYDQLSLSMQKKITEKLYND